jgi:hypothetical protein
MIMDVIYCVEVVLRHFHRYCYRSSLLCSFVGGGFGLLIARYEWTRWTRRFTWFRPPVHNTLHPRDNWVVLLKSALSEPAFLSAHVKRHLPKPFIAQGRTVTLRLGARQVVLWWLKPYTTSRVLIARSSKWCLARRQQRVVVPSYRSVALNMARLVVLSVISPL